MSAVNTYVSQLSAGASTNLSLSLPLTQSTETFRVTVDDLGQVAESNEGNNEAEEIVEAETQQPLIADAGGPYAGAPGQSIAFDASGSSGVISNYQWDFGDGATGQGVMATHAYGAAGVVYRHLNRYRNQCPTGD